MNLSVIIPAYNDLAATLQCLNSLQALAEGDGHQWLIQDDASPAVNFTTAVPPGVASVVRNPVNLGFPGNCNQGAGRALEDVLFFVNQDIYAVPQYSHGWDTALLAAFDNSQVGIVGARLLFPSGEIQSAGGFYDARCQPFHRCLGYSNPQYAEVNTPMSVQWVTGAALAIRRELFLHMGGFDTIYKSYFEDVDICVKAQLAGFGIWYEPRCTLVHTVGSTGGSPYFMNSALTFKKRWVDSEIVRPDVQYIRERFW